MNKELQDKAWSVLPKEFKEEVKKYFAHYRCALNTHEAIINHIFGFHNLTSDEEGEEMLTVPRKDVMNHFREACLDRIYYSKDSKDYAQATGRKIILVRLFGKDMCLPDDADSLTQKPSKPRFKVGDKVVVCYYWEHDKIGRIQEVLYDGYYDVDYGGGCTGHHIIESRLEPYTEPNEKSRNLSQETANCDKHFDNFRNKRRLNIAAMAMQGILSNPQLLKIAIETYQEEIGSPDIYVAVAKAAKEQADALIAECE